MLTPSPDCAVCGRPAPHAVTIHNGTDVVKRLNVCSNHLRSTYFDAIQEYEPSYTVKIGSSYQG